MKKKWQHRILFQHPLHQKDHAIAIGINEVIAVIEVVVTVAVMIVVVIVDQKAEQRVLLAKNLVVHQVAQIEKAHRMMHTNQLVLLVANDLKEQKKMVIMFDLKEGKNSKEMIAVTEVLQDYPFQKRINQNVNAPGKNK